MLTTALYLKYATKTWYLLSRILLSADIVEQWSCNNDMRINTTKTKEMVICFGRDKTFVDSLPYIYMNGNYIRGCYVWQQSEVGRACARSRRAESRKQQRR